MTEKGSNHARVDLDAYVDALKQLNTRPSLFLTKEQFETVKKMLAEARKE